MKVSSKVSVAQLASLLECPVRFVYDHARDLGGQTDDVGRWEFEIGEAVRRHDALKAAR